MLRKLICIPGDINDAKLGLDECDVNVLQQNIDIVFHVAATVRFNEPLKDAANLNTFGTHRIMELCTKMKKLKVKMLTKWHQNQLQLKHYFFYQL